MHVMAETKPSYLADFLQSPANTGLLLAGAASAVALSFPYGLLGAAFPLLATLGLELIACLFVPDMPRFRRWADQQRDRRGQAEQADRLMGEIRQRCSGPNQFRQYVEQYQVLSQQVVSLLAQTRERAGLLGLEDRDRIADVPNEFLRLHLSLLVMEERARSLDLRDVQRKLAQINSQISRPQDGMDVRQLERARDEYEALLARHQRMLSKRTAIEAAILALPDQLAEVYQIIMGEGTQGDGARLSGAIANLRQRQDIESEIAEDLADELPLAPPREQAARRARTRSAN